ncbi:SDR family oxidoreductase [Methanobacterium sp. MBAC-LM]|uniref:SDR family oxidoreductase n=1 Tax=Methanobacterium sp. MBAC-LM TaxID=3412034 RepID=UPI003C706C06
MKNKQVAVTGGLGFIGSNLVEELYQDNEVVIIDNQSTGKIENINHLDQSNIKVNLGDINSINLNEIFEGCEYVFHQAAIPSVPRSINDPLNSNEANITSTLKVLIAACERDIKKIVFASSSSVYGDIPELPKIETMQVSPKSPYAVTKAACEQYCNIFKEIYGLQTISLRYFNVFGPRQDPYSQYAAVIPKFITSILKEDHPIVYGDGMQSRDFTFIKNVINANILAAKSNKTGIFNIACGKQIKLNELIFMINELTGKKMDPKYVDPRPGDIKHSLADISKAKSFGYKPKDNFKGELEKTINFFRSNHH